MRPLHLISLIILALFATGCSDNLPRLMGGWSCTTTHPGNFTSRDSFQFMAKGEMFLDSDGVNMSGRYTLQDDELTIELIDVPVSDPMGRMMTQPQTLRATIQQLTDSELVMDVSTGQNHHLSSCRRH
ncbi:MAG TPA: hypothetical protein VGE00_04910 [Gammaproteobacteria bacterium]